LIALGVVAALTGCRDGRFANGSRVSDRHVIAGRTSPVLTAAELRAGSFISYDRDLVPLEDGLRSAIGGRFNLTEISSSRLSDQQGTLEPVWRVGEISVFNPFARLAPGAPRGVLRAVTPPTIESLSFSALRKEIRDLCLNPLTSSIFPPDSDGSCDLLNLNQEVDFINFTLSDVIEGATITLRPADIQVRWQPPSRFLNQRVSRVDTSQRMGRSNFGDAGFCSLENPDTCEFGYVCPPLRTSRTRCLPKPCTTGADCVVDPQGLTWPSATCGPPLGSGIGRRCEEFIHVVYEQDAEPEHTPVLEISMPLDIETDLNDGFANSFATVLVDGLTIRYRVQPTVCGPDGCNTDEPVVSAATGTTLQPTHLGYRGPSPEGDLAFPRANIDVTVTAVGVPENVRVFPGAVPGLLLCTNPFTLGVCIRFIRNTERNVRKALARFGAGTGELVSKMLGVGNLADPSAPNFDAATMFLLCLFSTPQPPAPAPPVTRVCPFSAAALQSINSFGLFSLGGVAVSLPPLTGERGRETVLVAGPNGEFTDGTIAVLSAAASPAARQAQIVGVTIDTSPYARICGAGGACSGSPADCTVCTECRGAVASTYPFCQFLAPTLIEVPSIVTAAAVQLPSAPTVARFLDSLGNVSTEVRGIFTRPIEEAADADPARVERIYTRIDFCPSAAASEFECPARASTGEVAARFTIASDPDADGDFGSLDNCRDVFNPDQLDSDGDRVGNACDNCPCTATASQANGDGDAYGDACDDDADGDECFNALLITPIAGCIWPSAPPAPDGWPRPRMNDAGEVSDQYPLDTELGEDGLAADTDDDTIIDDCDPDDDNDLIPDDFAGDGLRSGTPCRSGETTECDDNCRDEVNPDQADETGTIGVGDVCEAWSEDFGSVPGGFFDPPGVAGPGSLVAASRCLADGPDCWGFAVGQCLSRVGGCGDTSDFYDIFDAAGARLARLSAGVATGSAAAVMPDLDGDGRQELVVGAPAANAGAGRVFALGSRDGAVLFELGGMRAGDAFGSALAVAGSVLFVGAPGARSDTGVLTGSVSRYVLGGAPYSNGVFYGRAPGDEFGRSLAVVGDGESIVGLLVGAPGARVGSAANAGRIEARGLRGALLGEFALGVAGGRLGGSDSAVLPNAFKNDPGGVLAAMPSAAGGRGIVVFFDWNGAVRWQVEGGVGERLGASLAFAADFNSDGRAEIAVGAPGAVDGRGRVYMADARGLFQTFSEGADGDQLGIRVAATGDLDGDGAFDLTIGVGGRTFSSDGLDGTWLLLNGVGGKDPNLPVVPGEPP